jgi:hypothetical protein
MRDMDIGSMAFRMKVKKEFWRRILYCFLEHVLTPFWDRCEILKLFTVLSHIVRNSSAHSSDLTYAKIRRQSWLSQVCSARMCLAICYLGTFQLIGRATGSRDPRD